MREEIVINPETMKLLEDSAQSALGNIVAVELLKDIPKKEGIENKSDIGIPKDVGKVLSLFDAKLQ